MVEPQAFPLLAFPKAWTPGTNGPVTAEAVMVSIEKEEDFAKYQGKLAGKLVMVSPLREFKAYFDSPVRRFTDKELDDMSKQPAAAGGRRFGPGGPGGFGEAADRVPPEAHGVLREGRRRGDARDVARRPRRQRRGRRVRRSRGVKARAR